MKHSYSYEIVKMADIGFISILYASIGLILAKIFEVFDKPLHKESESKKYRLQIFLEFLFIIFFVGIISYFAQFLVNCIPSPFEGQYGLHHYRLRELGNVSIFIFVFLYFQKHLVEKMQFLFERLW
jgi:hypothetical protein